MSFQSKRLRRSVEPRRDAGRRDLGTRVQDSIVGSEYLSPNPERHMGRSLQRNIFDRLCTLQGRERPARSFLSASHPQTVRDSRTPQKISTSPKRQKTSPESTRIMQSETTLCHVRAGALGGSSGRVREVWRERDPSPKEGSLSLQGLSLRLQGLSYPSTASFSNPARLILCEAFFGNSSATGTKRTTRL